MKKNVLIFLLLFIGIYCINGQTPEQFNYQGVLRNSSGELIKDAGIGLQISLLEGSSTVSPSYVERHSITTNNFGQFTIIIGNGTAQSGSLSSIDWVNGPIYLKTEIDETGGNSYISLSTVQLTAVPYALYAKNVENNDDADADPSNEIQDLGLSGDVLTITNNSSATQINLAPFTGNNTDEQELSLSGDTLFISNGNKVVLPYDSSNWAIKDNTMYYNGGNVGIGSSAPVSTLEVKANTKGAEALFQVINANNDTVFAVYPDGVKVFVGPAAKGKIGGFAVSGRNPAKAGELEYFRVTTDSTRIYVDEPTTGKGKIGGFAVSGRNPAKSLVNDYFVVTNDSTRIYVNDTSTTKGKIGGFAVSGRNPAKGSINEYLQVTKDSTRIYIDESSSKGKIGGFAVSGRNPAKGTGHDYFNISANSGADILNPSEARIFWYPKKEAFLTGRVLVESADSVGTNSMATGYESKAIGNYSQAMGYKAVARGNYSTAIGDSAVAIGLSSFSFGNQSKAIGEGAYAFGKETIAKGKGSYAFGSNLTGTKTQALNENSFALGLGCVSNGIGAITIGTGNSSNANYSFAAGRNSTADNIGATAIGHENDATGDYATALGYNTTASGSSSTALGYNTTASGINALAIGMNSTAGGAISIALGEGASAGYQNSIAIGQSSSVTEWHGVALGYSTEAHKGALATGYQSKAYGQYSVASGYQPRAYADYAVAIGDNTRARAEYSTAMGFWSESKGDYSFAMGRSVIAKSYGCFVVGQFNDTTSSNSTAWVSTDPLFIVGNGVYPTYSNAFTVLKNGNVGIGTSSPNFDLEVNGSISSDYYYGPENNDYIQIDVSENLKYIANNIEVLRIESNGNIGIRDSDPEYRLDLYDSSGELYAARIYKDSNTSNDGGLMIRSGSDTGSGTNIMVGCYNGAGVYKGGLAIVSNGNVQLVTGSDRKLKNNIVNTKVVGLDIIDGLRVVDFEYKDSPGIERLGFIAQEVKEVYPRMVSYNNQKEIYEITQMELIPVLTKAIQEQNEKIDKLEKENQELRQLLLDIKNEIETLKSN